MGSRTLGELAQVVRSKNAKPYRITFDVIFNDRRVYECVKTAKVLTPETIVEIFGVRPDEIVSIHEFDAALAIKFTLRRRIPQGNPGDTDIYGCQQHAPLLDLKVPWP